MSAMTNFAENKLIDFMRGQGLTLPAAWHFGLLSSADDTGGTEVTGTSYGRASVTRSLANFCGTQGAGTTVASTGTSHITRNNALVTFPTAGAGGWTSADYVGLYDASSGGNLWFYGALPAPIAVAASSTYSLPISAAVFELGLTGGMTDYLANKLIDLIWRAQAFSWAATNYIRLVTSTPTNAAGGVEVTGGGYARQALVSSLAALSGTQGAGTTVASSGTGGRMSNNGTLAWPTVTAGYGTVTHWEMMDALTLGNRLWYAQLGAPKTVNTAATPPSFAPNTLGITVA